MSISIAFIGGGNMATSLVGGLLSSTISGNQILVAEPDLDKCRELEDTFGVSTTQDNIDTLASDIVILAVKPQRLQSICRELAETGIKKQLFFISIAAGVRSTDINRWLGGDQPIVRCMPNTPALLQQGATALYCNNFVSEPQKNQAEKILQAVGITLFVENETQLDAVTALSGSGPAYFFLLMEAMQKSGESLGLDKNTAEKLTLQTALGAARMATEDNNDATTLRSRVISKGGTTEQAINSFIDAGFYDMVMQALVAAHKKSKLLADELGEDVK